MHFLKYGDEHQRNIKNTVHCGKDSSLRKGAFIVDNTICRIDLSFHCGVDHLFNSNTVLTVARKQKKMLVVDDRRIVKKT